MKKILIIVGATSTGKTDLALRLAKKFDGELVACDSRQVYRGLDIGTGKLPGQPAKITKGDGFWEIDGIKIWMYDVVVFKKQYTIYDYVKDASRVIDKILKRGKLPIIVGGSGLYLKALIEGLPNLSIPVDLKIRKELERLSLGNLQKKLQKLSPKKWEGMNNSDRQNSRRLVRAIEIISIGFTSDNGSKGLLRGSFKTLKIGLTAERDILYKRIDERVISRINQGMLNEAKKLQTKGLTLKRMKQLGLEYGILADFLEGKIREQELIKIMQSKIHGFARRQLTWFKKEKEVTWFDVTDKNYIKKIDKLTSKWYDTRYAA